MEKSIINVADKWLIPAVYFFVSFMWQCVVIFVKSFLNKCMKFISNTVSNPIVGKEAKKLIKAVKADGHVANEQAMETIKRIVERRSIHISK